MTTPLSVAWAEWPEGDANPHSFDSGIELVPVRLDDLTRFAREKPGVRAVVVDVRPFGPADWAEELRGRLQLCPLPVLLRVPADRVAEALKAVRHCDDVCVREAPADFLAHRVRRVAASQDLDPLTRLLNRRAFYAYLDDAIAAATPEAPVSLLFIDVDGMKCLNDMYGHLTGDRVIDGVAYLLPNSGGVLSGRLGGDEFATLAPGLDEAAALRFAETLCATVAAHRNADGIPATVSVGVYTTEAPTISAMHLLEEATKALYEAKKAGRNRAVHYRSMERAARRAGGDVQIRAFEAAQRVISERAIEAITRRGRLLLEELQARADHDGLTGLFNRGYLDRRLPRECEEAQRDARRLCVALIDVDHFGAVNKTLGWPSGDGALREVAGVIRRNVRDEDWVARYGGEEIAVVFNGAGLGEAAQVVERVRAAVESHPLRSADGQPFSVTISAAVVEVRPGETPEQTWIGLSQKLLAAKNAGRNRVEV